MASESESENVGGAQPNAVPNAPAAALPAPTLIERAWKALRARPDPLTGVALTLPVFLFYHLGILLVPERTSVDLVSRVLFVLLDASASAYLVVTFVLALAVASVVWVQRKRGAVPVWSLGRVLLEAGAFALLLLVTLGWATYRLSQGTPLSVPRELTALTKLVIACGTGFHGELVFHALLVSGGSAALVALLQLPRHTALGVTVTLSSLAFAAATFLGPLADAFAFDTLMYRGLLGLALSLAYLVRGFAVAVYAHVFYAALVFFVYA